MTTSVLTLLILLNLCHLLADFSPLSTSWMLHAKKYGRPLLPIVIHAGVHALLMALVLLFFAPFKIVILLTFFQWGSHFLIDVGKGRLHSWLPILDDNSKSPYWILFGLDQFLHHAVIIAMVAILYF